MDAMGALMVSRARGTQLVRRSANKYDSIVDGGSEDLVTLSS